MTQSLAEFQAQLRSDDMGVRMRVLNQARVLSDSDRFTLAIEAVQDPNPRIRYDAVSQLANLGQVDPAASLQILLDRLMRDSETDVRAAAADSIGALKLTSAFDDLLEAFRSTDDWMLQFSIIAALGELGDTKGFDILQECLNHPTDLVRIAAVGALGDLGDARALPVLLPLVHDEDWQIRHRTAQSLCRLGGTEAKAAITTLLDDPISQVAEAAKTFLTMIV